MPGFLGGSGGGGGGTGGEISFPKEFVDPVTKLRVSNPENLIDTDFEYGLQPTKWETVELINNTPSFFSKSGDTTIDGIISMVTNAGTREITVETALDHNLAVGIPINVTGTKSLTADGSFIIASIPNPTTFTYLCKANQNETISINDLYTSIITGEFFQGSQIGIDDSEGIITDGESVSTLTVKTRSTHGFGEKTPLYFLNINSTISQDFQAANTASLSFDASNSATAQSFDGSNTLSTINIDWSNSGVSTSQTSTISSVSTTEDTITVTHGAANFVGLTVGTPLYYDVQSGAGFFNQNPRGVVFLKTVDNLGQSSSTFEVSELPDGDTISIEAGVSGTFQVSDLSRTFAGNNIDPATQTLIDVIRENAFVFDGGNQGYDGDVQGDPPDNTATVIGYTGDTITVTGDTNLDYYEGAMILYSSSGSAASGLTNNTTYFVKTFSTTGTSGVFSMTISELPGSEEPAVSGPSGGTGTQTFEKIGVSVDKDIVHVKNSFFSEKDMLEYIYPTSGDFGADVSKNFYFVARAYDQHNYRLNPVSEAVISATGGNVIQTVVYEGRNYTVHRFTTQGNATFTVVDEGTFEQQIKYVVSNGSFDGNSGSLVESSFLSDTGSYAVSVNSGGRVDVAYPQDGGPNNIPFNLLNPIPMSASGGSVSEITVNNVNYKVHTFTSVGASTFAVSSLGNVSNNVEYLIVAGGGGGGQVNGDNGGGGGGGGGVRSGTVQVSAQSYQVVVGAGGFTLNEATTEAATRGGSSSFAGVSSNGGGGGGGYLNRNNTLSNVVFTGYTGGSSGGGSVSQNAVASSPSGQGFAGGLGVNGYGGGGGGGGGGVGGTAGNTASSRAGNGGIGFLSSINGTSTRYAGGGGGGGNTGRQTSADLGGAGGSGGGGRGATSSINSVAGQPNTGGGGGGGGGFSPERAPARGGSGIVIIRYPITINTSAV
jgi:hypothetical protein